MRAPALTGPGLRPARLGLASGACPTGRCEHDLRDRRVARHVQLTGSMYSYIRVKFERMPHDPSVEASAQRWVARLESAVSIHRASVAIEPAGRRATAVSVQLELVDGAAATATASHGDVYVAVTDAFRAASRQLLARAEGGARRPLGARGPLKLAFA